MAATKLTMTKYKSKWGVNDLVSFQVGCEVSVNKGGYIKSFTKDIKPSIIQKHQAFLADFVNYSDLVINGGTWREEKKAPDALNYTVHGVQFLTEYHAVMGRSRVGMYESFTLLIDANNCFYTKVNHGRSEPLTKDMVL